jgi:hypothetical protein
MLIAVSLFMNTSIINIGNVGIPLFYSIIPVLTFFLIFNFKNKSDVLNILFVNVYIILLLLIVTFHISLGVGNYQNETKQLVSRSMFIVFFYLSYYALKNINNYNMTIDILKYFLKVLIIYGIYQLIANFLGLPLFLDFLRNSASFPKEEDGLGGWLASYRIHSVWSEASFSALPISVLIYCLYVKHKNKLELSIWTILIAIYGFLTLSRLIWILLIVLTVELLLIKRITRFFHWFNSNSKPILIVAITFLVIYIPLWWSKIINNIGNDLSSIGRSSSIIVGYKIITDNILLGTGFNSYYDVSDRYAMVADKYNPEIIVHSLFISYWQQNGIIGLIISLSPIIYILYIKNITNDIKLIAITVIMVIGIFGGDLYYFSLTWFFMALIANHIPLNKPLKQQIA